MRVRTAGRAEIQRYWEDWFSVVDEERSSARVEDALEAVGLRE